MAPDVGEALYHVVFDDKFQTVFNDDKTEYESNDICETLFVEDREWRRDLMRMDYSFTSLLPLMKYNCLSQRGTAGS